jgi:hypothetical protein
MEKFIAAGVPEKCEAVPAATGCYLSKPLQHE